MAPTGRRPDHEQMRKLEDAAADNLEDYVLAYGKVAPQLDAQCLRVASGVAAFTGIGSPLTTVKGASADLGRTRKWLGAELPALRISDRLRPLAVRQGHRLISHWVPARSASTSSASRVRTPTTRRRR